MANVEHSALTGSNLHEPKGASTATVSTVYVSDGVGSGAWSTLDVASLASTAKAFQGQLFHTQNKPASGTAAQAYTTSIWNTCTLTTSVTNEITSASLASNQITLPAGTYYLEAISLWYHNIQETPKSGKLRFRNITDGSTPLVGTAFSAGQVGSSDTASAGGPVFVRGRFTIASAKIFELQAYPTSAGSHGGLAVSSGESEVYSDIAIWKVA